MSQTIEQIEQGRIKAKEEIKTILDRAALFFEYPADVWFSSSRKRPLVVARYLTFLYLSRLGYKSNHIGEQVGLDHSTVLYGIQVVVGLMEIYKEISEQYIELEKTLKCTPES